MNTAESKLSTLQRNIDCFYKIIHIIHIRYNDKQYYVNNCRFTLFSVLLINQLSKPAYFVFFNDLYFWSISLKSTVITLFGSFLSPNIGSLIEKLKYILIRINSIAL